MIIESVHWSVSQKFKTLCAVLIFLGLGTFIISFTNDQTRTWFAFLVSLFYFTSVAIGGLFFTALQHVTQAGWSVNIRRFCESFASFLPWCLALTLIFIVGVNLPGAEVYPWMNPATVAADSLLQHKSAYLNNIFFTFRMIVFFGAWIFLGKKIIGHSLAQDKDGSEEHTRKNLPLSIGFLALFTLSYSILSIDLLMSLDPHWFSTIFGVYAFAGLFQSTLAFMILFIVQAMKKGIFKGLVNENHLHDLGKFLFGFTIFWAYIAFSQYMLIWYANLPEETFFFATRSHAPWLWVSLALIIFKFIVPFLALLPRWAKRSTAHLSAVSILILIMQFVDIYWLVYPNLNEEKIIFGFTEIGIFAGMLGAFLWVVRKFFINHSVIPHKDPRIEESVHHHVTY